MKKSKLIGILIAIILVAIIGLFSYFYFFKSDTNTTLTIAEKQWIDSNKNKVYDLEIIPDIPVLNYEGTGIILDFITEIEKDTGLKFNKIVAAKEEKSEYKFLTTEELNSNDVLIYKDNYVLVGLNKKTYQSNNDLINLRIGTLKGEIDKISNYLTNSSSLTYKDYNTKEEIINAVVNKEVDLIAVPKLAYIPEIVSNDLTISYHIDDYVNNYVLRLGTIDKLNVILKKYYKKWNSTNFDKNFGTYLTANYFSLSDLTDKEKATLKSKTYIYGYIPNSPYENLKSNKLVGINSTILRNFKKITGIKIEFSSKHDRISDLVNSFNANDIDIFYGINGDVEYKVDNYKTVSPYGTNVAIVSHYTNKTMINSLASLGNSKVSVLRDSYIKEELAKRTIDLKEYDNLNDLMNNIDKNSIIVIDLNSYNFYKTTALKDYKIDSTFKIETNNGFNIRNISSNKVFAEYFDFYLGFTNKKELINNVYGELLIVNSNPNILTTVLTVLGGIVVMMFAVFGLYKYLHIGAKKVVKLTKNDKIKYIDMLTSLKNRAYLNDHIDAWDNSEVYPQAIVIVDLNNVAYINDNYGYQEGDNVIKEAANILIKTQEENSEIIRTSGNEFLIYLVGKEEKEIVSYTKKLTKEMKSIAHGFGSATGYSMIIDQIKTIDDAINEATLQMRDQKEEQSE